MSQIRRQTEDFSCENILNNHYTQAAAHHEQQPFVVDKNYKAKRDLCAAKS